MVWEGWTRNIGSLLLPAAYTQGQVVRKDQSVIGHQAVVVEGDTNAVGGVLRGSIYLVLPVHSWLRVSKPLSQIQRSTSSPFQEAFYTQSFGIFGLKGDNLYG